VKPCQWWGEVDLLEIWLGLESQISQGESLMWGGVEWLARALSLFAALLQLEVEGWELRSE